MNSTANLDTFTVPLSFEAHEIAQECTSGLSHPDKIQQIYKNTLAVYAADYYLRLMAFTTDWPHSDSRDPLMLQVQDVADLKVDRIGTLECRPILSTDDRCPLPFETQQGRVGYILVELTDSLKEATILGFTPTANSTLTRQQLVNVDEMIEHLSKLEGPETAPLPQQQSESPAHKLNRWLQVSDQEIVAGWQYLKTLFGPQASLASQTLDVADKTRAERGKIITLKSQEHLPFALVLDIQSQDSGHLAIRVKVRTARNDHYLPPGLELALVSESGDILDSVQAETQDNWMQLPRFRGTEGEEFQVQLRLDTTVVTETFVL